MKKIVVFAMFIIIILSGCTNSCPDCCKIDSDCKSPDVGCEAGRCVVSKGVTSAEPDTITNIEPIKDIEPSNPSFDTYYNKLASSSDINEECGYVRAEGTDIKISYYKYCKQGDCLNVKCDYMFRSSISSEGKLYNCYGTCQKIVATTKSSSGQYCVFIKFTGSPDYEIQNAANKANRNACPSGETCREVGDCAITLRGSDAIMWDCDGVCR